MLLRLRVEADSGNFCHFAIKARQQVNRLNNDQPANAVRELCFFIRSSPYFSGGCRRRN